MPIGVPLQLTGKRFGMLKVLSKDSGNGNGSRWLCRCDCGSVHSVLGYNLNAGKTNSCGCRWNASSVSPGDVFGLLTAISVESAGPQGKMWLCKCQCGNTTAVRAKDLTYRNTKSCGCRKMRGAHKRVADPDRPWVSSPASRRSSAHEILALAKSAPPAERETPETYVPAVRELVGKGYSVREACRMVRSYGCRYSARTLENATFAGAEK